MRKYQRNKVQITGTPTQQRESEKRERILEALSSAVAKLSVGNAIPPALQMTSAIVPPPVQSSDFFILSGRPGGQVGHGGTGSGQKLTLVSNQSRNGKIYFGFAEQTAYDETNERLGINTPSPAASLHIRDGNLLLKGTLQLEDPAVGTNIITLKAPTAPTVHTLTLPITPVASGLLQMDAAATGVLSWVPIGALASAEFVDSVFRIIGSGDPTKKLAFEVDGIFTGTTRTVTVPDASGTLPLLERTQIWSGRNTFNPPATGPGIIINTPAGGVAGIDDPLSIQSSLGDILFKVGYAGRVEIGALGAAGVVAQLVLSAPLGQNQPMVDIASEIANTTDLLINERAVMSAGRIAQAVLFTDDNATPASAKLFGFTLTPITAGTTRLWTVGDYSLTWPIGLTAGGILFAGTGGASSSIAQDASNLFWDDTFNRLGLGRGSGLTFALDMLGNQNSLYGFLVTNSNAGSAGYAGCRFANDAGNLAAFFFNSSTNSTNYGGINSFNMINAGAAALTLGTTNLVRLYISSGGAVGLGEAMDFVGAGTIEHLSIDGAAGLARGLGVYFSLPSFTIRGVFKHAGNTGGILSAGGVQIAAQGCDNSTAGSGNINFFTTESNSAGGTTEATFLRRMIIRYDGNVGIQTTAPSTILSLGGEVARTFGMERRTGGAFPGNILTIQAGGSGSSADQPGGALVLSPGIGKGSGQPAQIRLTGGAATATTSTTDKASLNRIVTNGSANLTTGVATSLASFTLGSSQMADATVFYYIEADNGTDFISLSGIVHCNAVNKAGVRTRQTTVVPSNSIAQSDATDSLMLSFSMTNASPTVLQVTPTLTGMTATTFRITYNVVSGAQQTFTVP